MCQNPKSDKCDCSNLSKAGYIFIGNKLTESQIFLTLYSELNS